MEKKIYKYRTGFWNPSGVDIQELEIEKETPHSYVVVGKGRQNKYSRDHQFYDSHEEAKQYLIEKTEKQIKRLQCKLDHLKTLTPPQKQASSLLNNDK